MGCRYGEGIIPVTFCTERERDIGQSLTKAQDNFVELAINLVTHNRDNIFDILKPEEWYQAYNRWVPIIILKHQLSKF